jgi:hypothetical protein
MARVVSHRGLQGVAALPRDHEAPQERCSISALCAGTIAPQSRATRAHTSALGFMAARRTLFGTETSLARCAGAGQKGLNSADRAAIARANAWRWASVG